jgi:hypothetical protein
MHFLGKVVDRFCEAKRVCISLSDCKDRLAAGSRHTLDLVFCEVGDGSVAIG